MNIIYPERSSSLLVVNCHLIIGTKWSIFSGHKSIHTEFYKEWWQHQRRFMNILGLQVSPKKHTNLLLKWYMAQALQQVCFDWPVSQWTPVYAVEQVQLYPLTASVHVALCWHGDDEHSLMSGNEPLLISIPIISWTTWSPPQCWNLSAVSACV